MKGDEELASRDVVSREAFELSARGVSVKKGDVLHFIPDYRSDRGFGDCEVSRLEVTLRTLAVANSGED